MESTLPLSETQWSTQQKLFFRFVFLYFIIYIFFNPNNEYPVINYLYKGLNEHVLQKLIPWIGKHILHLPYAITTFTNGSGDTTYDYVLLLFGFVVSVLGFIVWSVLDRKSINYDTLYYWLIVIVRYYLIYNLISYGLAKVYKTQFPAPYLTRLVQPYGNSSPMGLAWIFLGQSTLYNYFMGFAELLPAFLLIFRRTQTIGALLSFAVMLNILMINLGYDVCVKLLSFHLCLMSLLVAARDIQKVFDFFFLHRSTLLSALSAPIHSKKWRLVKNTVKLLLLVWLVGYNTYEAEKRSKKYSADAPKPALYGIYHVTSFIRNNDTIPPLATDTTRWNRLIIPVAGLAQVRLVTDTLRRFAFEPDTILKQVVLYKTEDASYANSNANTIESFTKTYEELVKNKRFYSSYLYKYALDAFKENPNKLVKCFPDSTIIFDTIYSYPKHVSILIDESTVSAGELFLLKAVQSDKVIVYGQPTNEGIELLNQTEDEHFPCPLFTFYYPLVKLAPYVEKKNFPTRLSPNIEIPYTEKDWVKFVIDKYRISTSK